MSSFKSSDNISSELKRIKIEKEEVRDRLNEIRPIRKRERDRDDFSNHHYDRRDGFERKRRMIPSSVSVSDTNKNEKTVNNSQLDYENMNLDEIREERKAALQTRKENTSSTLQDRNRRMFGNLLGHLNRAKTIITKDQSLFDRQRKLEQDVIEREKKDSEMVRAIKSQIIQEQKDMEYSRLKDLEQEERILRLKKSLENRVNGFTTLSHYCLTESEPAVYWLPANGNSATEEYLKKSKQQMEEKCEEERKRVQMEVEALENQKKMREEERKRMEEMKEEQKEEMIVEKEDEQPKVDSKMLDLNSESEEEKKEDEKKEEGMEVEEKKDDDEVKEETKDEKKEEEKKEEVKEEDEKKEEVKEEEEKKEVKDEEEKKEETTQENSSQ